MGAVIGWAVDRIIYATNGDPDLSNGSGVDQGGFVLALHTSVGGRMCDTTPMVAVLRAEREMERVGAKAFAIDTREKEHREKIIARFAASPATSTAAAVT